MAISVFIKLGLPLVVIGMLIARRWSSRAAAARPSCRRCGYDVSQGRAPRCSECGADLLSVGVVTQEMARRPIPGRRAVVNAGSVLITAVITGIFAMAVAGNMLRPTRIVNERITVVRPLSGGYVSFTWTGARREQSHRIWFRPYCLRINYAADDHSRPFCVRPPPRTYDTSVFVRRSSDESAPILSDQEIPIEHLHEWATREGLDPADPAIALELDEMRRVATTSFRDTGGVVGLPLSGFHGRVNQQVTVRSARAWEAALIGVAAGALCLLFLLSIWRSSHHAYRTRCRRAAQRLITGEESGAEAVEHAGAAP